MQCGSAALSLGLGGFGKINGQHAVAVFDLGGFRFSGDLGVGRGFRNGGHFRNDFDLGEFRFLGRQGSLQGIQGDTHAQAHAADHAVKIVGFPDQHPVRGESEDGTEAQQVAGHRTGSHRGPALPVQFRFPAEDGIEQGGGQHQEDPSQVGADHPEGQSQIILGNAAGTGYHGLDGHEVLVSLRQDELGHIENDQQDAEAESGPFPGLPGQQAGDQTHSTAEAQAEEHQSGDAAEGKFLGDPDVQQHFAPQGSEGSKEPPGHSQGGLFFFP